MTEFAVTCKSNNEVKNNKLGRCSSRNEACWKVINFPTYEQHPSAFYVSVYPENGRSVWLAEDNILQHIQAASSAT